MGELAHLELLDLAVLDHLEVLEDQEVLLQILEEVVEVLLQLVPSGSSMHWRVSVLEDLDEGLEDETYPKGCPNLEEPEPRQASTLAVLVEGIEDPSCSPCTLWRRHEGLETPKHSSS